MIPWVGKVLLMRLFAEVTQRYFACEIGDLVEKGGEVFFIVRGHCADFL